MSSNNLRNKLIDPQIPTGFEWENMESDIISKMNDLPENKPKKKSKLIYIWPAALALTLAGYGVYSFVPKNIQNKKEQLEKTEYTSSSNLETQKQNNRIENETPTTKNQTKTSDATSISNVVPKIVNETKENSKIISNVESNNKSNLTTTQKVKLNRDYSIDSPLYPETVSNNKNTQTVADQRNIVAENVSIDMPKDDIEKTNSFANFSSATQGDTNESSPTIPSNAKANNSLVVQEEIVNNLQNNIDEQSQEIGRTEITTLLTRENKFLTINNRKFYIEPYILDLPSFKNREYGHSISILLGPSTILPYYSSAESQASESPLISYSSSLMYTRSLGKLNLSSGIGYTDYRSEFNFEKIDNGFKLFNNVIVERQINPFTQDTFDIKADTMLATKTTRTIIHNNQLSTIHIPLYVGYEYNLGRLGLGINGGIEYNRIINQKGKYLNNNEIIEADTKLVFKRNLWAISLAPQISYKINDKLSASMMISYAKGLKNISIFENDNAKIDLVKCQFGIRYKL